MSTHQVIETHQAALPLPPLYDRPEWNSIDQTVACPLCEYNLRGLVDPLCPECAYRFNWPDLLDPARRAHPWVFEHHPRHNTWSFAKTIVRSFRPGRFWKDLKPSQPSKPWRLVIYWLVCALPLILPVVLLGAKPWINTWPRLPSNFAGELWYDDSFRGALIICLLAAAFPWFTFLALLIFQQSMGRARVKAHHVMRCAVYSGDIILWAALLGSVVALYRLSNGSQWPLSSAYFWLVPSARWYADEYAGIMALPMVAAALLLNSARLVSAYRNYLKFDHALATVLAAQVVALLAAFALFLYVVEYL